MSLLENTGRKRRGRRGSRTGAAGPARATDYRNLRNPFPRTPLYSDDRVEAIHDAALGVLEDDGMRILLPEARPVQALERVIALNEAQELLERDVAVVDMRLSERPTVRMNEDALDHWWRVQKLVSGKEGR